MNSSQYITIVSAVFPPEPQVSAQTARDLASFLAESGHFVTVLCPQVSRLHSSSELRNTELPVSIEGYEDNTKIVRLPSFTAPKSKLLPRLWESISFGTAVTRYLRSRDHNPDVIYLNSWPLFSQAMIARYAHKKGIPLVLQIMDIYPESFTNRLAPWLRESINRILGRLDRSTCMVASQLVVISEKMCDVYIGTRGIAAQKVTLIPTWQDEELYHKVVSRQDSCRSYNVADDTFTFLYLGNIGPVAGVDFLIQAFAEARISDSQLLIVGEGSKKADCIALAEQLNVKDVRFISDLSVSNVPRLQAMADVCMLPLRKGAGLSSVPSKLPSYMFSAKPIIATVDSECDTADFVRQAECGWVCDAEDLTGLVSKMREVSKMPITQLEDVGVRGKDFAMNKFSKSKCVSQLAGIILDATRK